MGRVCGQLPRRRLFSIQLPDYAVVDPWNHHHHFDDHREPFCWGRNKPNCHGGKCKCKGVSKNTCRMQRIRMASETFDMQIRLPHCADSLPHCLICRNGSRQSVHTLFATLSYMRNGNRQCVRTLFAIWIYYLDGNKHTLSAQWLPSSALGSWMPTDYRLWQLSHRGCCHITFRKHTSRNENRMVVAPNTGIQQS